MPSLPIPFAFPAPLDAADLPVHGPEDVLAVMPDDHERAEPGEAPVFHALVEAEAELFVAYQTSREEKGQDGEPFKPSVTFGDITAAVAGAAESAAQFASDQVQSGAAFVTGS